MAEFDDRWPDYDKAIRGGQTYDPAMGLALVQNPEAIIPHLVARGAKPPADIPKGIDHIDAGQSLGRALGFSNDTPWGRIGNAAQNAPTLTAPASIDDRFAGLPSTATPSQQGAGEVPIPRPRPPTPAPEAAMATGDVPPSDTSQQPPEPTPRADATSTTSPSGSKRSGLDDLGQALAGVRALSPPQPQHIFSPQAPRPTNQIARSNAPQVLMQELMAAARPESMLRLGQALGGK